MSIAAELLKGSRTDVFKIADGMSARQLGGLDLRLVQSYKRTENTIEVKFADIAKLCEMAESAEKAASSEGTDGGFAEGANGSGGNRGVGRLRELFGICEGAAEKDEGAWAGEGSDMSAC